MVFNLLTLDPHPNGPADFLSKNYLWHIFSSDSQSLTKVARFKRIRRFSEQRELICASQHAQTLPTLPLAFSLYNTVLTANLPNPTPFLSPGVIISTSTASLLTICHQILEKYCIFLYSPCVTKCCKTTAFLLTMCQQILEPTACDQILEITALFFTMSHKVAIPAAIYRSTQWARIGECILSAFGHLPWSAPKSAFWHFWA